MSSRYDVHPMEQNFRDWDKKIKEEDYALNNFIAARWDELTKAGKHGHYETLYRLVRDAIKFRREQQEGAMNTEVVPIAWAEIDFGGTFIGVSLEQDHSSPFKWMPLYTDSLSLQERRVAQRRSKVDNDLAELYARRDKDRRAAAPNTAVVYQCPRCATSMEVDLTAKPSSAVPPNHIDLEVLWSKHKTGNDANARMSKENFFAAMTEAPNAAGQVMQGSNGTDAIPESEPVPAVPYDEATIKARDHSVPRARGDEPANDDATPTPLCSYCGYRYRSCDDINCPAAPDPTRLKLHGPTSGGMVAAPEPAPRKLRYIGASDEQVNYRGNDDPRGVLNIGSLYEVLREDIGDFHTDIYLTVFPKLRFNSVCFESAIEPAPSKESTLALSAEQVGQDYFLVMNVTEGRLLGGDDMVRAVLAVGRLMNQALAAIELERDNARHVQIAADQANEIAELKRTTIKLTPVELQSGLDRVRFAELLIKQLPETHDGRNTWLLNYSPDMADELKQRLKLAENLHGRTRIEGEEVGAPHLRED